MRELQRTKSPASKPFKILLVGVLSSQKHLLEVATSLTPIADIDIRTATKDLRHRFAEYDIVYFSNDSTTSIITHSNTTICSDEVNESPKKTTRLILETIDANFKCIALTFDDGPHPENTPKILAILKSHNIKATFFLLRVNIQKHQELTRKLNTEGHEIGNHTLNHYRLTELESEEEILNQIVETQKIIKKTCGIKPAVFRAPWLSVDKRVTKILKDQNLILYSITAQTKHFQNSDTHKIAIPERLAQGGIILMHDYDTNDLSALENIIDKLATENYKFTTCSQMSYIKAILDKE